jgi:5,10-methylenetetrahydrofolate reductase
MERLYQAFRRYAWLLRPVVSVMGPERSETVSEEVERQVKGLLFDCRMCGECALSTTGMVCPMTCGKQLRNGPCGGVREDGGCEVDPAMKCAWLRAYEGARCMSDPAAIDRIQVPLDHSRKGKATWLKIINGEPDLPAAPQATPSASNGEMGTFEETCRSGRFVVTAEISPPDSVDPRDLLQRAEVLRGLVDAVNVTDNAGANCHMSSAAASALLAAARHAPVFQAACRDRNRIAMQADIMGVAALGVKNILCLTGDGVGCGDQPQAKPVFDLDSVSLLGIVRGMCEAASYGSGRAIRSSPRLFVGATVNPFAPALEERVRNLEKKVRAGANFIQTQYCFDIEMLERFMIEVRARGLHRQCHILVGIGPLASARTARWIRSHVAGVHIPDWVIRRLEDANDPKREGIRICTETIALLRGMEGIQGVHLMGHRNEPVLAEIITEAGLHRRLDAGAAA